MEMVAAAVSQALESHNPTASVDHSSLMAARPEERNGNF